jgi:hypothetical protein
MDRNPATDRTRFSQPLLHPVALTPTETKQVAGGIADVVNDDGSSYVIIRHPPGGRALG